MPAFNRKSFAAIGGLALPIVLSMASSVLIALVDTAMISPLGELELAAAGLTATVVMFFYATLYGFVSIANVRMASAHGAGDDDQLNQSVIVGIHMSLWVGLAGALTMAAGYLALPYLGQPQSVVDASLPYYLGIALSLIPFTVFYTAKGLFDAIDRAWMGLLIGLSALLSNIPLNYLMIYGLGSFAGYGLVGAAIATLLSYLIGIALTVYLIRDRLRGHVSDLWIQTRRMSWDSIPVSIGFAGEASAFVAVGMMVGLFGAAALAANQIANAVGSVLYMVPLGVSIAISMLAGQAMGRGDAQAARSLTAHSIVLSASWMLGCAIVLTLSADAIAKLFGPSDEAIAIAGGLLIVHAVMQIGDGIQSSVLGGLRGMGDTKFPVAVTLLAYGLIGVPAAWVLGMHTSLGVYGLWIGYGCGLYLVGAVLCVRLARAHPDQPAPATP